MQEKLEVKGDGGDRNQDRDQEHNGVLQKKQNSESASKTSTYHLLYMFFQVFKIKVLLLVGFVQLCSTKFILPFSILQSGLEELYNSNRMTHKVAIYCQDGNFKRK